MTVSAFVPIQTQAYESLDPRYPIRRWAVWKAFVGDASGGQINGIARFRLSTDPPSGLLYGVDTFEAYTDDPDAGNQFMSLGYEGLAPIEGIMPVPYSVACSVSGHSHYLGGWAISPLEGRIHRFFGRRIDNFEAAWHWLWPTNTTTKVYRALSTGYIWLPRAARNGGPLWPGEQP